MGQLVQKHVLESPLALVVLTLAAHAAYYTLVIGGDHFEYRVYSHLVPLVAISILWMLNRLNCSNGQAVALVLVLLALSLPIPWTHWALSQANQSRKETY